MTEHTHTDRPAIEVRGLRLSPGGAPVLDGVDLDVPRARVTAVVGPNGCGKTTLLRALSRLARPEAGSVVLDGRDVATLAPRELARRLAVLPQSVVAPESVTVAELVGYGRAPYRGFARQWGVADDQAVAEAMRLTGTTDLAARRVDTLSGGQRQRVWIAMVLAQRTGLVLLDEPTTYLDLVHALDVMDLVRDLRDRAATTVVAVLHDLTLAARYADHVVVLARGGVLATGTPAEVFTPEVLADAFGLRVQVRVDPVGGGPLIVPLGRVEPR